MWAPQPAALTTTASTPAASKAAIVARASVRASSGSPAWAWSAPQHRWARGIGDLRALARETAERRLVVRAEDRVLDAAVEEAHARAPRPLRGHDLRQRGPPRPPGAAAGARPPRRARPGREQAQDAARPDQALEPAPLVDAAAPGDQGAEQRRSRQEPRERDAAHEAAPDRAGAPGLHLRPPRLDQVAVGHPGRAGALARPAAEAEREVLGHRVIEVDAPVGEGLDEVDPAARRVRLLAELRVRRAASAGRTRSGRT